MLSGRCNGAPGPTWGTAVGNLAASASRVPGWSILLAILLLSACAPSVPEPRLAATAPAILLPATKAGIADERGRFREIYCAVRNDHGARLPFDRPCDSNAALWRLPGEPPPSGRGVALGPSTAGLTVVMVPGLLAECLRSKSTVFADTRANLEAQGYRTDYIQTRGRQASEINAAIIRDAIEALPRTSRIVLVTHSKGTVDSLTALAEWPDLADRVVALVSVAGAVNGSPLADVVPDWVAQMAEFDRPSGVSAGAWRRGGRQSAPLHPPRLAGDA